ncbi:hypothetical protein Hanom_Chr15g01398991 [Helianthus anomalus]
MCALTQSIKDKDELTKCKDKLPEYKDQELKLKVYLGISWFMFFLLFVLMYAIDEIQKDEAIVAPIEEPESYVYFEDQDFEEIRPYLKE